MARIGDYQGLCTEYEKDIEQKNEEIERLRKSFETCKELRELDSNTTISLEGEIRRLKREKEWLLDSHAKEMSEYGTLASKIRCIGTIKTEMQQDLKEK